MTMQMNTSFVRSGQRYEDAVQNSQQFCSERLKARDQVSIAFLKDSARYLDLECTPEMLREFAER